MYFLLSISSYTLTLLESAILSGTTETGKFRKCFLLAVDCCKSWRAQKKKKTNTHLQVAYILGIFSKSDISDCFLQGCLPSVTPVQSGLISFIARKGLRHFIVSFTCAWDNWTLCALYKQKKMGPISLRDNICLNIECCNRFPCLSVILNSYKNKFLISSQVLQFLIHCEMLQTFFFSFPSNT